jgi:hypothetical protein
MKETLMADIMAPAQPITTTVTQCDGRTVIDLPGGLTYTFAASTVATHVAVAYNNGHWLAPRLTASFTEALDYVLNADYGEIIHL